MSSQGLWIENRKIDFIFIIAPSFVTSLLALSLDITELSLISWVILVLCIDVAHVYSTLYKTYLNPKVFNNHKNLLSITPLVCWFLGVFIYQIHATFFWSTLAYLAVFHFIRQQYGIFRLYSHKGPDNIMDKPAIYLATLYPIIYWHTYSREFYWMIKNDFLIGIPTWLERVFLLIYIATLLSYLIIEFRTYLHVKSFNYTKNLFLIGTVLSWYVGIVYLNNDFAFTLTNVVSHGVPYLCLIWLWNQKEQHGHQWTFKIFYFLGLLFILAFLEEGLWHGLVWREHLDFFLGFENLSKAQTKNTLSWLIPTLALPQVTHYVLDGFIWRKNFQ
jgi:hypothetical protein